MMKNFESFARAKEDSATEVSVSTAKRDGNDCLGKLFSPLAVAAAALVFRDYGGPSTFVPFRAGGGYTAHGDKDHTAGARQRASGALETGVGAL